MKFTQFLLIAVLFLGTVTALNAQKDKSKRKSPPAQATAMIGAASVTVDYSSPAVKGRTVWGDLVPYDKVWRTGANEATTFETDKDLLIDGQKLPAGKYAFFTIPTKDKWTIIFNSDADQWGAYGYKLKKDVLRVEVSPMELEEQVEHLVFEVEKGAKNTGKVMMKWDKLGVGFDVVTD